MQELVGAAVWCLIPYQGGAVSSNGSTSGWKVRKRTEEDLEGLVGRRCRRTASRH